MKIDVIRRPPEPPPVVSYCITISPTDAALLADFLRWQQACGGVAVQLYNLLRAELAKEQK